MKLLDAIRGFIFDFEAAGYSPRTARLYKDNLAVMVGYLGDRNVKDVSIEDLRQFMNFLKTQYKPKRFSNDTSPLSPSAVDNYWKSIRGLFKWCELNMGVDRPDLQLARPKYKLPEIKPFSEAQIKDLIDACEYTTMKTHPQTGSKYRSKRPTAARDKALVMLLLDTGLRLGEVNRILIEDVNLENGEILIRPHGSGQKTKPRTVILGKYGKRAFWRYLAKREDYRPGDKLFDLSPSSIRGLLNRLGERASVTKVYPHRFRHTFAVMYLRNSGDIYTLKRLLGHSSLAMVEKYLYISTGDLEAAHRRASPVDAMRLT